MTREEALKVLDAIPTIGEQVDALEMAIKALEKEPCDDAISREEALKHSHIEFDDDGEGHRVVYVEEIEDLPSVTPQRDNSVLERVEDCISRQVVLNEIRAEIIEKFENCDICEWFDDYDYEENDISEYQSIGDISDIIEIIDKYRMEAQV